MAVLTMKNHLVLETPRFPTLGHRIITSTGFGDASKLQIILSHPNENGDAGDVITMSRMVTQHARSGLTSREGIEKIALYSPRLPALDREARDQLRAHLSHILQGQVQQLLDDPDLVRKARERTVVDYFRLDEWLESIEAMFLSNATIPEILASIPDDTQARMSSGANLPADRVKEVDAEHSMARENKATRSHYLALACLLGVITAGIGIALYRSARASHGGSTATQSIEGNYHWLPKEVDKPRTGGDALIFGNKLSACWEALESLVNNNGEKIEDWKSLTGLEDYPIREWLVGVSFDLHGMMNDMTEEDRFTRVQGALLALQKTLKKVQTSSFSGTNSIDLSTREFLERILDARQSDSMTGYYAELDYGPTEFFTKALQLYEWKSGASRYDQ